MGAGFVVGDTPWESTGAVVVPTRALVSSDGEPGLSVPVPVDAIGSAGTAVGPGSVGSVRDLAAIGGGVPESSSGLGAGS